MVQKGAERPGILLQAGLGSRRSAWTVATRPYKGAHFATFPPALIEPCILAGCPIGGTVLDPFGGSGTTAGVALAHGRNAVLCELNEEYAALVPDRVAELARALEGRATHIEDLKKAVWYIKDEIKRMQQDTQA